MTNPVNTPRGCRGYYPQTVEQNVQSHRERDDGYQGVVCYLSERWRIVICRDDRQWIVQKRSTVPSNRGVWIGKSYVTSRTGLITFCSRLRLRISDKTKQQIEALPSYAKETIKK
jgi:hypothetical protein